MIWPLHAACEWGRVRVVRSLLYLGADVYGLDYNGCNPLHVASRAGQLEIIKILVETDSELINSKAETNNWTALHFASSRGYLNIVQYLVESNANINATALFGSPLHAAVREGHMPIIQYLLKHGAELNTKSPTPLEVACQQRNSKVVRYLIDQGADLGESIHYVVDNTKILRTLIKRGANVCSRKNGKSILEHDWVEPLLQVENYKDILHDKELWKSWNMLALVCWQAYGKGNEIVLFQLSDDKENIKAPATGSKIRVPKDWLERVNAEKASDAADGEPTQTEVDNVAEQMVERGEAAVAEQRVAVEGEVQQQVATTTEIETSADEIQVELKQETVEVSAEEIAAMCPNTKHDDFSWMLHAAAAMPVCPASIVTLLCKCFPNQVRVQRCGCTPLLLACRRSTNDMETDKVISYLLQQFKRAAATPDDNNVLPLAHAMCTKKTSIQDLVDAYPGALEGALKASHNPCSYILEVAAKPTIAVETIYQMIRHNPSSLF